MESLLLVLGVAIFSLLLVVVWLLLKPKANQGEGFVLLQQQLQKLTHTVDERLSVVAGKFRARLKLNYLNQPKLLRR